MIIKRIAVLGVSAAMLAALAGCSGSNSSGTTSPPTVNAGAATTLGVQAVDASTGEPIANTTFTITGGASAFSSPEPVTEETGIASFAVNDANDPTVTAINASVRATAAGYLDSNKSIVIEEQGAVDLEIPMMSITGDKPTGVEVATSNSTSTNGTVAGGIEVTAATTANNNANQQESVGISVAQSVIMTDANDNEVTGNLTTKVAYYDANSPDALEAFPGGFAVTLANPDAVNVGDSTDIENGEVSFISGGFTAVEITNEAGTKVKNFSSHVPITFTISEDTINPDTGEGVKLADGTLPVWSFDVDSGQWRFEGTGNISDPTPNDGLLQVTYQANHLSYWNLDWFRAGNGRCRTTTANILSSAGGTYQRYARGRISASGYSQSFRYRGDGFITFKNAPRNIPATITFTDPTTGEELVNLSVTDLCSLADVTLTPPDEGSRVYADVTVKTVTYCSNDTTQPEKPIPGSYVLVYQSSPRFQYIGRNYTNSAGEATYSNLLVSTGTSSPQYRVYVRNRINNRWDTYKNQTFSADNNTLNVRIPQTCEVTTGSAGSSSGS